MHIFQRNQTNYTEKQNLRYFTALAGLLNKELFLLLMRYERDHLHRTQAKGSLIQWISNPSLHEIGENDPGRQPFRELSRGKYRPGG